MPGPPPKHLCGIVVSAGKMMKAVKVRTAKQTYNKFLQKVRLQLWPTLTTPLLPPIAKNIPPLIAFPNPPKLPRLRPKLLPPRR